MRDESGTSTRDERDEQPMTREPYVPPMAEDIDIAHGPAETAAGTNQPVPGGSNNGFGVEESSRWH